MKTKLLLAGAATVAVLGAGAAISWAASSPSMPDRAPGAAAMHRAMEQADLERMADICEQAMEKMHDGMTGDGMTAEGMTDEGMMGSGGMMGR